MLLITGDSIEFIAPATAQERYCLVIFDLGSKFDDLSVHYFDDDIVWRVLYPEGLPQRVLLNSLWRLK